MLLPSAHLSSHHLLLTHAHLLLLLLAHAHVLLLLVLVLLLLILLLHLLLLNNLTDAETISYLSFGKKKMYKIFSYLPTNWTWS